MSLIKAEQVTAGMVLVNLGKVDSIELHPASALVRIVCTEGLSLSSAFYWFRYGTWLYKAV
jgi:hypothetical protein